MDNGEVQPARGVVVDGLFPRMSGMDKGMNMNDTGTCKLSMLWNWNTTDACFVSSSWHITSQAMFVCCCFGVMCLVISLEFLRRMSREYDSYIIRQSQKSSDSSLNDHEATPIELKDPGSRARLLSVESGKAQSFRPSLVQQIIRSSLHMVQFGVAYLIMLLAMYFNGYFILSILLGAFIGPLIFNWERIIISHDSTEVTGCCG